MKITIKIDNNSGVCGGVKRAIRMIEENLETNKNKSIYVNGELLHNRLEMERLVEKNLKVETDVRKIKNSILFIRTHGVSRKTKEIASKNHNEIIDATCPKVLKSQKVIESYSQMGYQIVIVGKENHPEVHGLLGYCENGGICIMNISEIDKIDLKQKTLVIAQTTVSRELFDSLVEAISKIMPTVEIADTICSFVGNREKDLIVFAKDNDVVIFIGGRNSSNTKVLFEKIKSINPNSHKIENIEEINALWFEDGASIGISGSASTPLWQILQVRDKINDLIKRG